MDRRDSGSSWNEPPGCGTYLYDDDGGGEPDPSELPKILPRLRSSQRLLISSMKLSKSRSVIWRRCNSSRLVSARMISLALLSRREMVGWLVLKSWASLDSDIPFR